MRAALALFCLCVLFGCTKKPQAPTEPDTPYGGPVASPTGDKTKPPLLVTRPQLPAGWADFREPEGAFSVYLPGQPRRVLLPEEKKESIRQAVPQGRALSATYQAKVNGLKCQVEVTIYSPELVTGIKAAQEQHGPLFSSPASKRTAISWCGHPAYEETNGEPQHERFSIQRHVWIGNRHYICTLFGLQVGRPTAEERAAVFDSFTPEK